MAKEFSYMGKSLEELQNMSLDEFSLLAKSRARRAIKRGLDATLLKRVQEAHSQTKAGKPPAKAIRTHLRHFVIIPQMIGLKFAVHKGNGFENLEIQPEMVGHRLGEYVLTRKRISHGKAGLGSTKSSSAVSK